MSPDDPVRPHWSETQFPDLWRPGNDSSAPAPVSAAAPTEVGGPDTRADPERAAVRRELDETLAALQVLRAPRSCLEDLRSYAGFLLIPVIAIMVAIIVTGETGPYLLVSVVVTVLTCGLVLAVAGPVWWRTARRVRGRYQLARHYRSVRVTLPQSDRGTQLWARAHGLSERHLRVRLLLCGVLFIALMSVIFLGPG